MERPQARLGYEKGDPACRGSDNHRNGSYPKSVPTEDGAVDLDVPRDRNGTFEPQIVSKGETGLDGLDDKMIPRAVSIAVAVACKAVHLVVTAMWRRPVENRRIINPSAR